MAPNEGCYGCIVIVRVCQTRRSATSPSHCHTCSGAGCHQATAPPCGIAVDSISCGWGTCSLGCPCSSQVHREQQVELYNIQTGLYRVYPLPPVTDLVEKLCAVENACSLISDVHPIGPLIMPHSPMPTHSTFSHVICNSAHCVASSLDRLKATFTLDLNLGRGRLLGQPNERGRKLEQSPATIAMLA